MTDPTSNPITDTDLVTGRWEPCHAFAPEVTDSQVCGACGWLHDDHQVNAVVRQFPTRAPRSPQPRRLAS